ncbi:hypothetical protein Q4S45_03825 [Massilia sp. R2A-15]|uniref:hypothetical protein n=1 Tax=Massilia sp. R2A-15 TaxID=3064278 RepID=UPI00273311B5|nr:hypothetical protein [Massilia sp. R2A-15]WLI90264.1 hypothetical protein Q4S45_03825 [Massilia sp. R2A-15]
MRRRFGQALRLGVSHDALALVQTSRWGGEAVLLAERPYAAALPDALAALLDGAGRAGWPLTIVLADDLVRLWQVTPPADSTRLADLEAAAALRFQQLYGEPAAPWQFSAGWDAARPFLAAAMPRALLGALEQGASAHKLKAVEIVPQFLGLFNRWRGALRPGAWFGVLHDGVLTLGACDRGAIAAVRAARVPEGAGAAWLAEHLDREALRLNLPAPAKLQLCGDLPPAWIGARASMLGAEAPRGWSAAAQLAVSGSAA